MAKRTTIYCNDETEEKLSALLRLAEERPAYWSESTKRAAPTNLNQLVTALVDYGYSALVEETAEVKNRQEQSLWQALDALSAGVPEEEWARLPSDLAGRLDDYLYGDSFGTEQGKR